MKGIIFDMDGTMIDNMMVHHSAWQQQLARLGLKMSLEEVKEKIHGVNIEILKRLFGDRFTAEERERISWEKEETYRQIYAPDLKLLPGLKDLLKELQAADIPMAIGTAAPPGNVDFVLDALHLRPYFKAIVHSEDVTKGKPNPEVFIKAATAIGLEVRDCLIFEDSITGAAAAKRAHSPAIIVTTTHAETEFAQFSHIRKFIHDFEEIRLADLRAICA